MDADALRAAVQHADLAAVGVSFLAGLFFSVNPVALAAIPVSLAYVTKARERTQAFWFGTMFVLGILVTHAVLGLVAGLGGAWIEGLIGRAWGLILGPLLMALGLVWVGWLKVPLPAFVVRVQRPTTLWGAALLGAVFSVAVCPVCTPALLVLLGVATAVGSPIAGLMLLTAFALGRAVPVAAGAWSIGLLENAAVVARYRRAFEIAGAVTLVAAGLYMLNAYFFWVPALAI